MKSRTLLRLYKLNIGLMLFATGLLVLSGNELGPTIVPQVDIPAGTALTVAGLMALLAARNDRRPLYWVSYFCTTVATSIWTYTMVAYALFSMLPWGRVVVFAAVTTMNAFLLPSLISNREAEGILHHAQQPTTVEQTQATEDTIILSREATEERKRRAHEQP